MNHDKQKKQVIMAPYLIFIRLTAPADSTQHSVEGKNIALYLRPLSI